MRSAPRAAGPSGALAATGPAGAPAAAATRPAEAPALAATGPPALRALHNRLKRELIFRHLPLGARVLDLGAGRGGDLLKYRAARVRALVACEPDPRAFAELRRRAANVFPAAALVPGDVLQLPLLPAPQHFDAVASFFALQYLFRDEDYARACIERVARLLRPGGKLFGVVPDAARVLLRRCSDISVPAHAGARGPRFGESIWVFLPKTPYYSEGAVEEPLCYRELLVQLCAAAGLRLVAWDPFHPTPTSHATDTYASFVFEKCAT